MPQNTPTSKIRLHIHTIPRIKEGKDLENPRIRSYNKKNRREPVQWTAGEVEALKMGVSEFGVGRWKVILEKYREKFYKGRTASDLSDKYKLMNGRTSYENCPKVNFVEVDDNGEVVCNALGEHRVFSERFPHAAAVRAGKFKLSSDTNEAVVTIQGKKDGVVTSHKYRIFNRDRIRAKKLFSIAVEGDLTPGNKKPAS